MIEFRSRIVWVLGSGFSVPLGGPTLGDLFGPEGHHDLQEIYRDDKIAQENVLSRTAQRARQLFLYGMRFEHGSLDTTPTFGFRGEKLWGDAEAFLDTLETAALTPEGPSARRLEKLTAKLLPYLEPTSEPVSVVALRDAARRLLAIDCSRFLFAADTKSEKWEPYRQWKRLLTDQESGVKHTVVTFNYDLVLERLGLGGRVLIPPADSTEPDDFGDDQAPNVVILKMHGSVNWRLTKGGIKKVTNKHFAATCRAAELAIAPPGPEKAEIAKNSFGRIWRRAEEALAEATGVVFLGYRFPETDARARRRLLTVMQEVKALRHVVLGADVGHPHAVRMHGLLLANRPSATVILHPLYAQDFMTVWTGQSLGRRDAWLLPTPGRRVPSR